MKARFSDPWTLRLQKQNLVQKVMNIPDSPPNIQAKQTWRHRQKVTQKTIGSLTRSKSFSEPPPLNRPLKRKMKSRYWNSQILLSLFLHHQRSTTATNIPEAMQSKFLPHPLTIQLQNLTTPMLKPSFQSDKRKLFI